VEAGCPGPVMSTAADPPEGVTRTYVPSAHDVIISSDVRPVGSKNGRVPEGGYRCVMSLNVRDDDGSLLHELAEKTRLGRVGSVAARPTSRPQTRWMVSAKPAREAWRQPGCELDCRFARD
jgi:hypothetical protein